jgi:hypothetical protein
VDRDTVLPRPLTVSFTLIIPISSLTSIRNIRDRIMIARKSSQVDEKSWVFRTS